jgi:hypothetical protein
VPWWQASPGRYAGRGLKLGIGFAGGQLRVEACGPGDGIPGGQQPDPGLAVVALIAQDWGTCPTPDGTATYFTLGQPGPLTGPPAD